MIKSCIIYFHGFNSGLGSKVNDLKKEFSNQEIIAEQLDFSPGVACYESSKIVEQQILKGFNHIILIGTSLGGYLCLNSYIDNLRKIKDNNVVVDFYLINPSLNPLKNIKKYINQKFVNYKTKEENIVKFSDYVLLKKIYNYNEKILKDISISNLNIFLSIEDNIVDHSFTNEFIERQKNNANTNNLYVTKENQDHRFQNITNVIKKIKKDNEK